MGLVLAHPLQTDVTSCEHSSSSSGGWSRKEPKTAPPYQKTVCLLFQGPQHCYSLSTDKGSILKNI